MKTIKSVSIDAELAQRAENERTNLSGLVNSLLTQHFATEAGLSDEELEEKRLKATDALVGAKAEQERRAKAKAEASEVVAASRAATEDREARRARYAADLAADKRDAGLWLDSLTETEREALKLEASKEGKDFGLLVLSRWGAVKLKAGNSGKSEDSSKFEVDANVAVS